jgi:predicted AAA+ superfamily ATPase
MKKTNPAKTELMALRSFEEDDIFSCITWLINNLNNIEPAAREETSLWYCDCIAEMASTAEALGLRGNIWHAWLAVLFAEKETPFSLAQERRAPLNGTLKKLIIEDLDIILTYIHYDLKLIDAELAVNAFSRFAKYVPLSGNSKKCQTFQSQRIQELADKIAKAEKPEEIYSFLTSFYGEYGVGKFALNKAFRWDSRSREIVPVNNTEDILLTNLIGYEGQKQTLVDNTIAFIDGRPANNVLLYGESGTGKSSSIKALLNEYASKGLRMIEVYKHQIEDLDTIVDILKNRNYKFIIFMDDLSFEQFEIEYKYLKAFIEGGLEKRPDNILIYATSNRRHLMKETWGDREDKDEDMHESETMQERMSLVDRFGLMIRYSSPEQDEYLDIVHKLAKEYKLKTSNDELEHGAIRWELKHGGFSGRSARQFVEYLAGINKK